MLIIDTHAEDKLIPLLEAIRAHETPASQRALHFKCNSPALSTISPSEVREHVVDAARRHLADVNPDMYICEDGDIFILAPNLLSKDARVVMLSVATTLAIPVSTDWVDFYELDIAANKLLVHFEEMAAGKRFAAEQAQKRREEEAARRKREAILGVAPGAAKEDIASRRTARGKPEIMIIEDDAFSRRLVEKVLEHRYGFTALDSAERALSTYAKVAPDIVFLDINLPDVTGHELLSKIIAMDPQAYIIMLSGNADKENIMQAMSHGAKGFVAKPFSKDKLFQYIDRCPTLQHERV